MQKRYFLVCVAVIAPKCLDWFRICEACCLLWGSVLISCCSRLNFIAKSKPKKIGCILFHSILWEFDKECIGETKRPIHVHKFNVNQGNTANSKLAKYVWDNNHCFKFEYTRIIHSEQHYLKRKFVEATFF